MQCVIPQWYIASWCLGDLVIISAQPRWVFYSLRSIIFIYDKLQNIYYFTNLNQLYVDYDLFWMIWVFFEYIEIMIIFWSMNMICDFRVSISWILSYANYLRNDMLDCLCFIKKICVKDMIMTRTRLGFNSLRQTNDKHA